MLIHVEQFLSGLAILYMTFNVTRSQILRATRIAINIIEKIRIVIAEAFSRHELKKK